MRTNSNSATSSLCSSCPQKYNYYYFYLASMDPLTTLSLAGTVVQFVDFGTRLFTESYGLFKSTGESLAAHEEREFITRDLIVLISKLNHLAFDSTSGNVDISQTVVELQSPLESLCDRAKTIAEEILNKLNELKIPREIVSKGSKLKRAAKSLQVVIRSSWSRTELDDLLERLGELRKSIDTNVLFDLRLAIPFSRKLYVLTRK
jgi:hypothetical protein